MQGPFESFLLLFFLLNPFLLAVYLLDLIRELSTGTLLRVMARGAALSGAVFGLFAWGGDAIFQDLQVSFASFQIFGGIVFLIIGIRFVFLGAEAIRLVRGTPEHLAGSVAMPFMIGPGTVGASVVIGKRLPVLPALGVIALALVLTVLIVGILKVLHDRVRERNDRLIQRYVEVTGRLSALLVGSFSVDMILRGLGTWVGGLALG